MPGPRVKGKRSSAVQLRAAHVRPLQSGSLLAVRLKAADVTAAVTGFYIDLRLIDKHDQTSL